MPGFSRASPEQLHDGAGRAAGRQPGTPARTGGRGRAARSRLQRGRHGDIVCRAFREPHRSNSMTGPVVLLTTNLARGGAEAQGAPLALSLSRRGWPVSVVSLLDPSAFQAELREANVQVRSLGMQPGRPNPLALARLAAILRKERPCVLHSHMFHANLLARLPRL